MPPTVPKSLWNDFAQSLNNARLERQHAWSSYRDSASRERRRLKEKCRHKRRILAALPVSNRDNQRKAGHPRASAKAGPIQSSASANSATLACVVISDRQHVGNLFQIG
jgi:hypothetical protein